MIIRPRPRGIEYFFLVRGSILPAIWLKLAITVVTAILVTLVHGCLYQFKVELTPIPFSLMGLALAIFLGFRNSASYERYWEARKLWGSLNQCCRNLVRQTESFVYCPTDRGTQVEATRHRIIRTVMAFPHSLRHHLRGSDPGADLGRLLMPEWQLRLPPMANQPAALLHEIGQEVRACLQRQALSAVLAQQIDQSLNQLSEVLGSCERIKNTPIPFSYSVLLHRTVYIYCYLLPFGLVDTIGKLTPVVVGIVAYTFFGLDAIGDEIEEPFGTTPNDLPLTALSYAVEIDLRQLTGDEDLPAMPQPINYCLQ